MTHRWQAARLLDQGLPYHEVAAQTGASTTTVTRVAHWLRHGEDGYRLVLDRRRARRRKRRLTIAIPAKGRLREPAVALLHDAGLGPEQPGERALAFPCRNAPVDVLLVRAADIPEYVQDGVVDCGITGTRPRGGARRRASTRCCSSASARCTLEAAVPAESRSTGARGSRRAARVATVYPRLAARLSPTAGRRGARRDHGRGRGRPSARARRRDRGPRLEREHPADERAPLARRTPLVGGGSHRARGRDERAREIATVFRSVVEARDTRYLMLNAPRARSTRSAGSSPVRARRASLPLAEPGMVALHALVPAADVWRLLPQLEAAGGSSILLVPSSGCSRDRASPRSSPTSAPEATTAVREWALASRRRRAGARRADGGSRAGAPRARGRGPALARAPTPARCSARGAPGGRARTALGPVRAVGIYVPRGLVSTLVMCAVPAHAAGVERIVVATPPAGRGRVASAAKLLGLEEVWALGGPPAIAALAYGTKSIPRVDKICGPGGTYVNEAKLLVSRDVPIDLPAGPSEVVVLAGDGADPRIVELELAAQAEHGPDSMCRVVSVNGDLEAALAAVEELAPEHLVAARRRGRGAAARVRNAGAVFVGRWSAVAAGDYATGGTTSSRPVAGREPSAGSGWRPS